MKYSILGLILAGCLSTGCLIPIINAPSDTIIHGDSLNRDQKKSVALAFTAPHLWNPEKRPEDLYRITVNGFWHDKPHINRLWYLFPMIPDYPSEPYRQLIFDFYPDQISMDGESRAARIELITKKQMGSDDPAHHFIGNEPILIGWEGRNFTIQLDRLRLISIDGTNREIEIRGTINGTASVEAFNQLRSQNDRISILNRQSTNRPTSQTNNAPPSTRVHRVQPTTPNTP